MCGGGGDTTNVTETGLGDDQYANLTSGQQTIRDDISYLGDEAETRYDNTTTRLGEMADATEGRFDDVDNSLEFIGNLLKITKKINLDSFMYLPMRFTETLKAQMIYLQRQHDMLQVLHIRLQKLVLIIWFVHGTGLINYQY